MKCKNCGGQIGLDMEKCPYCNAVNRIAVNRKSNLEKLHKDNEKLENELITKSKASVAYKFHKKLNLVLLIAGIIFWGSVILWNNLPEGLAKIKHQMIIDYYYQQGEYDDIYWYMSDNKIWGGFNHDDIGFVWQQYQAIIEKFAEAHETYVNEGVYDKDEVCTVIFETYMMSGLLKRSDFDEAEEAAARQYLDEIVLILKGAFKMPIDEVEILINGELSNYDEIQAFAAQVWEAMDER